ncbi:hypothetical protein TPHA_0B01660 [Tetrapisispora phaffii CBS 4417]|uniref:BAR domain-containing protein n=1 Tax=Tetrapisispora phaffii (strain ATCC 24235 / CBS 4417 / NBRC 1672 / NRRL Y-8282 / UCD 70-5) TaxID=1071381 RepID=G8BPA8_TETPH|nr:hypothetical protein TPHA_0B01660 [Tetrapisispora phaffii CBS 4417]CCE61839.1 hypothetical protein TPHA_0B01660 [Tetrapisispora phaffii CBS 4417]
MVEIESRGIKVKEKYKEPAPGYLLQQSIKNSKLFDIDDPTLNLELEKDTIKFNCIRNGVKKLYRYSKIQRYSFHMSGVFFCNTLELFYKIFGKDENSKGCVHETTNFRTKNSEFNKGYRDLIDMILLHNQMSRIYCKIENSLKFFEIKIILPLRALDEAFSKISYYIQYRDKINVAYHELFIKYTELKEKTNDFTKSLTGSEEVSRIKIENNLISSKEDLELANDKLRKQLSVLFGYCRSYFKTWFLLYYFTICRIYYDLQHFMRASSEFKKVFKVIYNQQDKINSSGLAVPTSNSTEENNTYTINNNNYQQQFQSKENMYPEY